MNLSWLIAGRLAASGKSSFARFIIRMAIGATALSVMVMIVAMAFTNGFRQVISDKIFSFWGHIRIQQNLQGPASNSDEYPIIRNDSIEQYLRSLPGVGELSLFAVKSALLRSDNGIESLILKGVESSGGNSRYSGFLREGKWISQPSEGYGKDLCLSKYIADKLMLNCGDSLLVYFFREDGSKTARKLRVTGIFKTGLEEYDKNFALCDINLIRRLNNWEPGSIAAYELFLKDHRQTDSLNNRIYSELPQTWYSQSIREAYPAIFDWLNLQEQLKNILLAIMMAVAIANLLTCLIILVLERTRMTGLLKALGARDATVRKIFLFKTGIIAFFGILAGTLAGLGLCWLQKTYGFIKLNEETYFIRTAKVEVIWWQVIAIDLITWLVAMASLIIPTYLIRKTNVIKAISFR